MSYKLFLSDIKNNKLKNVILAYGTETYLLNKAWEKTKSTVVTAFPELNYTLLEGEHLKTDQLIASCETFPFACEKRLVVVRNLYHFKSGSKTTDNVQGSSSDQLEDLLSEIKSITDTTYLLFIYYGNLDKRKKIYTAIKKEGCIYEFSKVEKNEFGIWIKNVLGKDKKVMNPRELEYFIHRSGYLDKNNNKTLYDIENEIKKLISYAGSSEEVLQEHIDAVMPRNVEHDIFKLINACSEKKISQSLKVYNDLILEGESSLGILAMISRQIKNIIAISELEGKNLGSKDISIQLRVHEYTVKLCMKYSKQIQIKKLVKAFNRCLEAEMNIKSGKMVDRLAIELLLVDLFE